LRKDTLIEIEIQFPCSSCEICGDQRHRPGLTMAAARVRAAKNGAAARHSRKTRHKNIFLERTWISYQRDRIFLESLSNGKRGESRGTSRLMFVEAFSVRLLTVRDRFFGKQFLSHHYDNQPQAQQPERARFGEQDGG